MNKYVVKFLDLSSDFTSWAQYRYKSWLIILGVAFASMVVCQNPFQSQFPAYKEGSITKTNIKAPQSIRILDEEATEARRELAAKEVPDVFDFDSTAALTLMGRVEKAFSEARALPPSAATKTHLEDVLDIKLSNDEWALIRQNKFSRALQSAVISLLQWTSGLWITDEMSGMGPDRIVVRDLQSGQETTIDRRDFPQYMIPISEVRQRLKRLSDLDEDWMKILPLPVKSILTNLVSKLIEPNMVFNKVETGQRRDEARAQIEAKWVDVTEGEMILREGQRVDRKSSILLKKFGELQGERLQVGKSIAFMLLIITLILSFYWVGKRNFRKFRMSFTDQWVTGGFLVAALFFIAGLNYLFVAVKSPYITTEILSLLLPLAFASMTLRLFTSMEITTFFTLLFSMAVAWMLRDPYFGLIALGTSLIGASLMRHIQQRLDVFKAGLAAGCVKAVLVLVGIGMKVVEIPVAQMSFLDFVFLMTLPVLSGLISSAIVLAVQPLLEYLGYTTDLRLTELSSTNHPLLKELIIKAPGTYFHSFTVSQLAEKAAEAIHANALFARVASLYHDIGKVKKPQYFIENIKGENKHDKLAPSMSALIISNHVKDGIELGLEYKLPQSIIEIIPQHHGTSIISYFYNKAQKQTTPEEPVDQHDFQYPGPKPQTREAAIILLADAVEATSKSLHNATLDDLRRVIDQTIQRFFLEGQLEECELSLKDLTAIGNAFLQVLQGVYHQRIDCPHLRDTKGDVPETPNTVKFKPFTS